MNQPKTPLAIIVLALCLFSALAICGQTESLGPIKYTPPKGFQKNAKDHAVVFSDLNPAEGGFCFITLYAAGVSEGTPQKDFVRAWNERVVKPWGGEANPKTNTEPDNGWTVIAGGTQIDFSGKKAFAFLTVVSGFGKSVSLLGILNDNSYLVPLQAFAEGLEIDKTPLPSTTAVAVATQPVAVNLQYDSYGHLLIPPPTRQLTLADLAGNWGESEGINVRYVDRYTGAYAGADSLHYKSKMTFTAAGGYYDDFYAIQNGKMIKEKTAGSIAVQGRILMIKQNNLAKYVIRGWLELPNMTILEVCGPWYDDDPIPQEILTNPNQGANLNRKWGRTK